jgi:hypothetical protein
LKKDLKIPDVRFESATKRTRGSVKASAFARQLNFLPRPSELSIHGLNRWTVNCLEMSKKRGVQAARNGPSPPPCGETSEFAVFPTAERFRSNRLFDPFLAVTSGYACAIGWLLLAAAQPPKLTPYSSSARPPPSVIWPPPSALRHSPVWRPSPNQRPNGGIAKPSPNEAPLGFTDHWALATGHYFLATRHSPLTVSKHSHTARRPSASAARGPASHTAMSKAIRTIPTY